MTEWFEERVLRAIEQWLRAKWDSLWDTIVSPVLPYLILIEWWMLFGLLFVVLMVLEIFLPFDWYRKARAIVLAFALAFVAGGTVMLSKLKQKRR